MKREAILFFLSCSEVNSTWQITSELANQCAQKPLFTSVVYANIEDYIGIRSYRVYSNVKKSLSVKPVAHDGFCSLKRLGVDGMQIHYRTITRL